MGAKNAVLKLWARLAGVPGGKWLFSRLICLKAPYFASVRPRFLELRAGHCAVAVRKRRAVTNHLGTVHAIALCNLAELAGGMVTEASLPDGMRWIPKGMTVEYRKKAVGTMRGVATPAIPVVAADTGYELPVIVDVHDPAGDIVFRATIAMWLSPKR